jgi:hypothetical protein
MDTIGESMSLFVENEDTTDGTVHYVQDVIQGNLEYGIQVP